MKDRPQNPRTLHFSMIFNGTILAGMNCEYKQLLKHALLVYYSLFEYVENALCLCIILHLCLRV